MPHIINAYDENSGSGIVAQLAKVSDDMFGNGARDEMYRQNARKLGRQNDAAGPEADAFRSGNYREMGAQAIMGDKEAHAPAMGLMGAGLDANGNINDPRLNTAAIGAGHSAESTVWGEKSNLAQRAAAAHEATTRAMDLEDKKLAQPSFAQTGEDPYGNKQFGFIDKANNTVTPYSSGPEAAPMSATGSPQGQLGGDEFLKTLPPQIADQVKAISEGRMAIPTSFALKTPYWQRVMQHVGQYDPSFDFVNSGARAATRKDFTSGRSAQSINALNTVVGHLGTLSDAGDKLDNTSFPAINSVTNYAANAVGDPRIKQFDATKKAVVDELTRAWRGSGGAEGDIKTWAEQIGAANSPAQLHGVIGQIGDLLHSKLTSLGSTYAQGMGTAKMPIQLLTPQSEDTLMKLRSRANGEAIATAPVGRGPKLTQDRVPQTAPSDFQGRFDAAQAPAAPTQQPPSIPTGAVQLLRSNPHTRDQFDAKFGTGAAASVLGQ